MVLEKFYNKLEDADRGRLVLIDKNVSKGSQLTPTEVTRWVNTFYTLYPNQKQVIQDIMNHITAYTLSEHVNPHFHAGNLLGMLFAENSSHTKPLTRPSETTRKNTLEVIKEKKGLGVNVEANVQGVEKKINDLEKMYKTDLSRKKDGKPKEELTRAHAHLLKALIPVKFYLGHLKKIMKEEK